MADVIDVLHDAGIAGFTYDPAADPPVATVKCFSLSTGEWFGASCAPCWWWSEGPFSSYSRTEADAQALANAHNDQHHRTKGP